MLPPATRGLIVANYKQFDSGGVAPEVTIDTKLDADPAVDGIQVEEGKSLPIIVTASDIGDGTIDPDDAARRLARQGQIRNVELIVDGQVVRNDVSFPFEDFFARAPKLSEDPVTVQVRATDTGGNITLSEPFLLTPVSDASGEGPSATNGTGGTDIDVVPDTFAPSVVQTNPPNGDVRGKNFRTLRVGFSESMDESTLTADHFQLIGPDALPVDIVQTPEGNLFQPIDIRIRRQGAEVQFAYARLVPGDYELHVDTTAVTDRAGNPLGDSTDEVVLQFTVIDADIVWINDGVAFWDDVNNWDTGQLPKPGDEVFLSGPDTAKAIYRTGTNSIKSLKGDMEFELQGGTLEAEQIKLDNTITLNGGGIRNAHILPGEAGQGITALNHGSNHLDSVRLDAHLNLTANNAVVTIYNQLTLNGTATIGYRARIDFPGSQTLTGTGTVVYATDEFYNRQGLRSTTNYSTFIIDAGITIRGGGGYIGYSEGWQGGSSTSTIINRGTIQADVSGRTIRINPVSGSFLNEGMIAATNGAILDVERAARSDRRVRGNWWWAPRPRRHLHQRTRSRDQWYLVVGRQLDQHRRADY